jgi:hypothetical protein
MPRTWRFAERTVPLEDRDQRDPFSLAAKRDPTIVGVRDPIGVEVAPTDLVSRMGVSEGKSRQTARNPGRRRAAGIYGTIVTAAVIAAGGNQLSTTELEVTVLVTLVVYWLAEQYAELLGEHTHAGRLPRRDQVLSSLASAWPMVSSSFIPLISLLLARAAGSSASGAAAIALVVTVVLLIVHGYTAARAAGLTGVRLLAVTSTAGLLGVAMVVLKTLLQHAHH